MSMTNESLTRLTRVISLVGEIGKREFYWASITLTTEGSKTTLSCVVDVDHKTLLSFHSELDESSLNDLLEKLEYTKAETLEDARDVLYHNKRGY